MGLVDLSLSSFKYFPVCNKNKPDWHIGKTTHTHSHPKQNANLMFLSLLLLFAVCVCVSRTIMAGSRTVSMPEPVCLIENDEDGKLRVVRSSQEILAQIDQHVVVVSVVGLYRTGKSYLMNKLAGKTKGG